MASEAAINDALSALQMMDGLRLPDDPAAMLLAALGTENMALAEGICAELFKAVREAMPAEARPWEPSLYEFGNSYGLPAGHESAGRGATLLMVLSLALGREIGLREARG
jgi:hypothetical protein